MLACQHCFPMRFCSCQFVSLHMCLFLWKQRPSKSVSHTMLNVYYCVCLTEIWISNKQRQRRWKTPGNSLHPQHTPAQQKEGKKRLSMFVSHQDKQIRIMSKENNNRPPCCSKTLTSKLEQHCKRCERWSGLHYCMSVSS